MKREGVWTVDIKQLTYFVGVANAGGYSQAARQLSISQPTLSLSLKKLEEELGVALFYSKGRRQQLTDEGERLLAGASSLLAQYRQVIEDVKHIDETSPGQLVLGLPPLVGSCFFGDLIPEFNRAYPNIQVSIKEEGARKLEDMMADGLLDLACTIEPMPLPGLKTERLLRRRNVAVLHKSHKLAGRKSLTMAQLRAEPLAIFNEDFVLHRRIMAACRNAGFVPQIVLLSSQWDFIVEMAVQKRGVAVLPQPILDKYPQPDVACIPLVDEMQYWDVFLLWNEQTYLSMASREFIRFTRAHFARMAKEEK